MKKKITPNSNSNSKQWLNIIIFVISAMILVFTLLGEFMSGGLMSGGLGDKPNDILMTTATLTTIDFGAIKITASGKNWQRVMLRTQNRSVYGIHENSSTELTPLPCKKCVSKGVQESTESKKTAQSLEYLKIAEQWQALLTRPKPPLLSLKNYEIHKTYFIQLYLTKPGLTEQNQPLVVKIEVVTDDSQHDSTAKKNHSQRQTLITFVSANLQFIEEGRFLVTLLPPSVIEGKD